MHARTHARTHTHTHLVHVSSPDPHGPITIITLITEYWQKNYVLACVLLVPWCHTQDVCLHTVHHHRGRHNVHTHTYIQSASVGGKPLICHRHRTPVIFVPCTFRLVLSLFTHIHTHTVLRAGTWLKRINFHFKGDKISWQLPKTKQQQDKQKENKQQQQKPKIMFTTMNMCQITSDGKPPVSFLRCRLPECSHFIHPLS